VFQGVVRKSVLKDSSVKKQPPAKKQKTGTWKASFEAEKSPDEAPANNPAPKGGRKAAAAAATLSKLPVTTPAAAAISATVKTPTSNPKAIAKHATRGASKNAAALTKKAPASTGKGKTIIPQGFPVSDVALRQGKIIQFIKPVVDDE
jgi:hypothetical protein